MDCPTLSICWLQDGARFEELETCGPRAAWVPLRTGHNGLTVHVQDRHHCGCMTAWRGDTGKKVRVCASDLFDVVTVEAR
jgi:hypothetical protein